MKSTLITAAPDRISRLSAALWRSGKILLATLALGSLTLQGSAQVTNNFTDGEGFDTADQFPGIAANGWLEGWTSILGVNGAALGYFGVDPHVITNGFGTPLFNGGNYFNFGIANSESTMRRRYTGVPGLDITEAHIIEFDIRMEWLGGAFNNGNDYITLCTRPNTSSGTSQNQSTFWIKALGANNTSAPFALAGRWNFYHGSTSSSSENQGVMVSSTNVPFALGRNYHFKILNDPTTKTYSASVTDGTNTFTTGPLRWRNFSSTSESDRTNATYFTVGTRTSTRNDITVTPATETNVVSLDSLVIYQAPLDNVAPKLAKIYPADGHVHLPVDTNLVFNTFTIGSTNSLPASNMVLTLNGVNVSAGLTFDGTDSSSNRTATYTSGFAPNTVYYGTFTVADQAGRTTGNTFWFDTFVESNVFIIEAEDYNFSMNLCPSITTQTNINPDRYLQNPLFSGIGDLGPVNMDEGYFGRTGEAGVDYFDSNPDTGFDYRSLPTGCDSVGIRKKTSTDYERPAITALTLDEYITERWVTNDWLNYTRTWPATNYLVYLRVGSGANQQFQLDRVTSDYQLPNQTTVPLGVFNCPVFQRREAVAYQPLADALGNPILLPLSGLQTLRLTSLNSPATDQAYINFLLFLPQSGPALPYVSQVTPGANAVNVSPDTSVSVTLANGELPVNVGTIALTINNTNVTGAATITPSATGATVSYLPPVFFAQSTTNTVQIVYGDGTNPLQTNQWSFRTGAYLPGFDRVIHDTAVSGGNISFNVVTVERALHIIEYKDVINAASWSVLTNVVGTGGAVIISDNAGGAQRYYRMRIP
jgi:hypothetical protein